MAYLRNFFSNSNTWEVIGTCHIMDMDFFIYMVLSQIKEIWIKDVLLISVSDYYVLSFIYNLGVNVLIVSDEVTLIEDNYVDIINDDVVHFINNLDNGY